jgi:hypothetical protein
MAKVAGVVVSGPIHDSYRYLVSYLLILVPFTFLDRASWQANRFQIAVSHGTQEALFAKAFEKIHSGQASLST